MGVIATLIVAAFYRRLTWDALEEGNDVDHDDICNDALGDRRVHGLWPVAGGQWCDLVSGCMGWRACYRPNLAGDRYARHCAAARLLYRYDFDHADLDPSFHAYHLESWH